MSRRGQEPPPMAKSIEERVFSYPEILEAIISYVDLQDKKSCRCVCKAWNQEVCRIFRKNLVAVINYDPDGDDRKHVSNFREIVDFGKELLLPSPFKDLKLSVVLESLGTIHVQLKQLPFSVTNLEFLSDSDQSMLGSIQEHAGQAIPLIQTCSSSLTHLKTPSWGSTPEILSTRLSLPVLKSLTVFYKGYRVADEVSDLVNVQGSYFLKCLAAAPRLEEFRLDGDGNSFVRETQPSPPYICRCLSVADLSGIQVLSVHISEDLFFRFRRAAESILTCLKAVKINQLKFLRISRTDVTSPFDFSLLSDVITQFSETLQEFSTNICVLGPFILPFCPFLKTLTFDSRVKFKFLDLSNLPSLKKIKLAGTLRESRFGGTPNDSVLSIIIDVIHSRSPGATLRADNFLKLLFKWFPNVSNWEVSDLWLQSELPKYIADNHVQNQAIINHGSYQPKSLCARRRRPRAN